MKPRALLAITALVATVVLSGCADTSGGVHCLPPPLSLTPSTASAGATVTLSADGVKCQAGSGRHYRVSVYGLGVQRPVGEVAPASDGSFAFAFAVPIDLSPGVYDVSASGSTLDDCIDPDASCAAYSTLLTVVDSTAGQR